MIEDFSEEAIKAHCPHCDQTSTAYTYLLERTDSFSIVSDANPIIEGHILIIPKDHVSCIGGYSKKLFKEFMELDTKVSQFIKGKYGSVSSFEHGIFGQTVFHSHVHYIPFSGKPTEIIPEGKEKITKIQNFKELKSFLQKDDGYLFFSIGETKWVVEPQIAAPRFFRDRFAKVLGRSERGNWKAMRASEELMKEAKKDGLNTQAKWKSHFA